VGAVQRPGVFKQGRAVDVVVQLAEEVRHSLVCAGVCCDGDKGGKENDRPGTHGAPRAGTGGQVQNLSRTFFHRASFRVSGPKECPPTLDGAGQTAGGVRNLRTGRRTDRAGDERPLLRRSRQSGGRCSPGERRRTGELRERATGRSAGSSGCGGRGGCCCCSTAVLTVEWVSRRFAGLP
jgi:hypothetical protein